MTLPIEPKDEKLPAFDRESVNKFLDQVSTTHQILLDGLDYDKVNTLQLDKVNLHIFLKEEIKIVVKRLFPQDGDEFLKKLELAVFDEVVGFGPAEYLLRDSSVTDIFINGPSEVYVERKGKVERELIFFTDSDHIFRLVQRTAAKSGRHLDLSSPYFDAQLSDRSRIHAIIPPLAIDGIKVSIRKYSFQKLDIYNMVSKGSLDEIMAKYLQLAVQARLNIAICGGTGSGKTTLLNSLLTAISPGERMVTIEDTPELEPAHPHAVRLLTRVPNAEGKGAVTQADLMINALRMRPDRVILGELRDSEAFNLLHAMNTGQDGTMVTLHASGAEEVVSRLINMILMARYALTTESMRQQIAGALDLIIYVARLVNGSRKVMTISQVSTGQDGDILIEDVFRYDIETITPTELVGQFVNLNPTPTKRIVSKLVTAGLAKDFNAIFKT